MLLRDDGTPFWREITLNATGNRVEAEVSDNIHQFRVTVHHNATEVTGVSCDSVRVPWITCPGAAAQLNALVGTSVKEGAWVNVDQSQQCTHMLDLARFAIAQISRGGLRRYRVAIKYNDALGGALATLECNSGLRVDWLLKDGKVVTPGPFEGFDTQGRSNWSAEVAADPDLREAGLVLRRSTFIFRSRDYSKPLGRASDLANMDGVCYSFQPERAPLAVRPSDYQELP